jgi:hypothetical protein
VLKSQAQKQKLLKREGGRYFLAARYHTINHLVSLDNASSISPACGWPAEPHLFAKGTHRFMVLA